MERVWGHRWRRSPGGLRRRDRRVSPVVVVPCVAGRAVVGCSAVGSIGLAGRLVEDIALAVDVVVGFVIVVIAQGMPNLAEVVAAVDS